MNQRSGGGRTRGGSRTEAASKAQEVKVEDEVLAEEDKEPKLNGTHVGKQTWENKKQGHSVEASSQQEHEGGARLARSPSKTGMDVDEPHSPLRVMSSLSTTSSSSSSSAGLVPSIKTPTSGGRKSLSPKKEEEKYNYVTKGPLRRGKWTYQEEAYVSRIINDFNHGLLPLAAGTTLRAYLSDTLNCDPMRITKKFAGAACIGKRVFQPCEPTPENLEKKYRAQAELETLRNEFLRTIVLPSPSSYVSSPADYHTTMLMLGAAGKGVGHSSLADNGPGGKLVAPPPSVVDDGWLSSHGMHHGYASSTGYSPPSYASPYCATGAYYRHQHPHAHISSSSTASSPSRSQSSTSVEQHPLSPEDKDGSANIDGWRSHLQQHPYHQGRSDMNTHHHLHHGHYASYPYYASGGEPALSTEFSAQGCFGLKFGLGHSHSNLASSTRENSASPRATKMEQERSNEEKSPHQHHHHHSRKHHHHHHHHHHHQRSSSEPKDTGEKRRSSALQANHVEGELLLDFLITVRRQHEEAGGMNSSGGSSEKDEEDSKDKPTAMEEEVDDDREEELLEDENKAKDQEFKTIEPLNGKNGFCTNPRYSPKWTENSPPLKKAKSCESFSLAAQIGGNI